MQLNVTACQYEPSFALSVVQPPAELELVVSRGAALAVQAGEGERFELGGDALRVNRLRRPTPLSLRATGPSRTDLVSVSLSAARLCELLGTAALPEAFRMVAAGTRVRESSVQAPTPRLLRLFDELVGEEVRGPGRRLWHEAKAMELVALIADELAEGADAARPLLSTVELEGLERVRRLILARLQSPPTLAELAREAAMSETKLKGAFRVRFDTPVFSFLRQARMGEARRLLLAEKRSVTEVAQRVGYSNPSKFAAAFRREFGRSPSNV